MIIIMIITTSCPMRSSQTEQKHKKTKPLHKYNDNWQRNKTEKKVQFTIDKQTKSLFSLE